MMLLLLLKMDGVEEIAITALNTPVVVLLAIVLVVLALSGVALSFGFYKMMKNQSAGYKEQAKNQSESHKDQMESFVDILADYSGDYADIQREILAEIKQGRIDRTAEHNEIIAAGRALKDSCDDLSDTIARQSDTITIGFGVASAEHQNMEGKIDTMNGEILAEIQELKSGFAEFGADFGAKFGVLEDAVSGLQTSDTEKNERFESLMNRLVNVVEKMEQAATTDAPPPPARL